MSNTADLPPWTDWDDRTRMQIIAFHRHWFLFDVNGEPQVIRRRKVTDKTVEPVRAYCEQENCDLLGDGPSMTEEARQQLRLAWAEYHGWQKANRR